MDMSEIKPGQYRHFEGDIYEVIGVDKHTEKQEELVVHRLAEGEPILLMPVAKFLEQVEHKGSSVPRFES